MATATYKRSDLHKELEGAMDWCQATIHATFRTDYVGGQPATPEAVDAFCLHHLKLTKDDERAAAVDRILKQEVRKTSGEGQEVEEIESYGLSVIRRNEKQQAWIGTWQVRAMLKQAASRLGVFVKKAGSKGDMAEMMIVAPSGISIDGDEQHIVIVGPNGPITARTYKRYMGSVNTPKGRMSIVGDHEVVPPGSQIEFSIRWPSRKVSKRTMLAILGACENIGLGSVKAIENGRLAIEKVEIDQTKGGGEEDEDAEA